MSDDQVGWRDEEVGDSLESCADGMMYFPDTGLRNYLCAMKKKVHTVHTDDCPKMGDNKVYPTEPDLAGGNIIHLYKVTVNNFAQLIACKRHVCSVSATLLIRY